MPSSIPALIRERLWPRALSDRADLWLQAVSVGEVEIAVTLLAALRQLRDLKVLLTSTTPAGTALLRKRFPADPGVELRPFPLDLPFSARRLFRSARPRLLVLVETELWPGILMVARREGVPVAVVNGSLSERTAGRLRAARRLFSGPVSALTRVAARSDQDAERFREIGVPAERISVEGDLKLDRELPAEPAFGPALSRLKGTRSALIAGSVAAEEVDVVLDAFQALRREGRNVLLILAPRQPEVFEEAHRKTVARGLAVVRRSGFADRPDQPADASLPLTDVFLLDSIGELAGTYRLGEVALIGGTLAPRGGHNVLEPLRAGLPTLHGPSTESIRSVLAAAGTAVYPVDSAATLARTAARLLDDPEARASASRDAAALFAAHSGAAARTARLLAALLDGEST